MYVPVQNFDVEQDQEIVCLYTGESYVYLEGNENSIIEPKHAQGSCNDLPPRFYKVPFVVRSPNGQVRVFGRLD